MAARQPLSIAKHDNVLKPSDAGRQDLESRLRKALTSLAEERRKRAEVEGVVDALKRGKHESRDDVETAKQELELAQAEIQAQKATILRLSAATSSNTNAASRDAGFESKLRDLMQKHEQAKSKYSAEIADLKASNTSLQSLISVLQTTSGGDKQTITDLRGERAALKAELESVRARAASASARDHKTEEWSRFKEERQVWRNEKLALEGEIKVLKNQVEDTAALGLDRRLQETEERCEALEGMLEAGARAYAVLYHSSASKEDFRNIKAELEVERSAGCALVSALAQSQREEARMRRENEAMRAEMEILREELDRVEIDLKELLEQRSADRHEVDQARASGAREIESHLPSHTADSELVSTSETMEILDIALSHISLSSSHTSHLTSSLLSSLSSLRTELESTTAHLLTSRSDLSALQAEHTSTRTELNAILSAHSDCADQLLHWRGEASRSGAQEARLRSSLHDTTEQLRGVEERAKAEREMLRRANEGTARWASAKAALEDEVASLRLALIDARGLEHRYQLLATEVEILRSREAMAADEAGRLGVQNAELIGHTNGVQKISYVEGIRREMALVKHELATTRHHLNLSTAQIAELQSEVDSYKSITPSVLSASVGAGRVRVARRQPEPEGGEVVRASVLRRSVSGAAVAAAAGAGRF